MAIYLGQERYDIFFTVKELASKMSKPTVVAMARLRKLLGYLKETSTYSLKLGFPAGDHVRHSGHENEFVLLTYSDANWSGIGVPLLPAYMYSMDAFCMVPQEHRRWRRSAA